MNLESNDNALRSSNAKPVVLLMQTADGASDADFMDLLAELWRRKWLLIGIALCFAVMGVVWALLAQPIYRVEVIMAPAQTNRGAPMSGRLGGLASLAGLNLGNGGDNVQSVAVLSSRAFAETFIADKGLLPVLFAEEWDEELKQWKKDSPAEQPTLWDGVKYFTENVLSVSHDDVTGLTTLTVNWSDPHVAASWAEELVTRINDQLRARDLEQSERKLEYLFAELEGANLIEVRQAISSVIEEQVQTVALAKGDREYAFRVIDPPRVPMKRASPQRTLIVVLATFAGGLVGIGIIFVSFLVRQRRLQAATTA